MMSKFWVWYDKYIVVALLARYFGYAITGAVVAAIMNAAHFVGGVDVQTSEQVARDVFVNYPMVFGIVDAALYAQKEFSKRKAERKNVRIE